MLNQKRINKIVIGIRFAFVFGMASIPYWFNGLRDIAFVPSVYIGLWMIPLSIVAFPRVTQKEWKSFQNKYFKKEFRC